MVGKWCRNDCEVQKALQGILETNPGVRQVQDVSHGTGEMTQMTEF